VFIFLLGFFVSCSNTPKKVVKKQDNSISLIDTVRFLAVNDSSFVRVSEKDTIGYAIDLLNRFSEEVGVPYRLILCSSSNEVIKKFSSGYGNMYLACTLHDSVSIEDKLLQSNSIVQRNTPLKAQEIVSVSQASNPSVNQMPAFVVRGIQSMILPIPDKHILVQSKFRVQSKDSLFMNTLDAYIRSVEYRADIAFLKNFYFGVSLPINMKKYLVPRFRDGVLSPYDKLFKSAAEKYDWDWKLLAAF
jgi:hypothetical protein